MMEKDFYAPIGAYYLQHTTNSMGIEVKITKTDRLSFKAVTERQEEKLLKAEAALYHNEPDIGLAPKNFDIYILHKATAVVFVVYWKPREKECYEIPIRNWIKEKYESGEKSLTKERAAMIGKRIEI